MPAWARAIALAFACAAPAAFALDTPRWPPPADVEARMHELQQAIMSRDSTMAQREAAREELAGLLKSPAGQSRGRTPDEKPARPARAAIGPFPSVVKREVTPMPPTPGVARVEVIEPPKTVTLPQSGVQAVPSGGFAVDPRTGNVLHGFPGGYIDPRTGQIVPR